MVVPIETAIAIGFGGSLVSMIYGAHKGYSKLVVGGVIGVVVFTV